MGLALEQPTKKGVSLVDDEAYELRYEYLRVHLTMKKAVKVLVIQGHLQDGKSLRFDRADHLMGVGEGAVKSLT